MEVITSGLTVRRATMTCMFLCGKSRKEVANALQIIETTLSNTITSSYYRKLKRGLDWSVQFIKSYTEKL
jgi:DNA-binding NarL/FixJ family response regulator